LVYAPDVFTDEADETGGVHFTENDLASERSPGSREDGGLGWRIGELTLDEDATGLGP